MTRISFLLLFALAILLSLPARADDQSSTVRLLTSDQVESAHFDLDGLSALGTPAGSSRPVDSDATCYTIDAYRVRRESPGSDVVFPDGRRTCVPVERFKVKSAIAPVLNSEPAK